MHRFTCGLGWRQGWGGICACARAKRSAQAGVRRADTSAGGQQFGWGVGFGMGFGMGFGWVGSSHGQPLHRQPLHRQPLNDRPLYHQPLSYAPFPCHTPFLFALVSCALDPCAIDHTWHGKAHNLALSGMLAQSHCNNPGRR